MPLEISWELMNWTHITKQRLSSKSNKKNIDGSEKSLHLSIAKYTTVITHKAENLGKNGGSNQQLLLVNFCASILAQHMPLLQNGYLKGAMFDLLWS